jgi:hypothetical protein
MKNVSEIKFDTIVRQYKAIRKKHPDRHIDFCVQQKYLSDAIDVAAKAINEESKIHSHQRRIGRIKLNAFAELLKLKESEIKKAKTFDKLLSIIESVKSDRIADLTYYDTATRIGAYLDLFPEKIYLHTGTRTGASYLFDKIKDRKFISVNELPKEFLNHDLTASEFEDILCIFKDYFKQRAMSTPLKRRFSC